MDKHTPGPIEKGYELTEKGYLGPGIPETTAQDTGPWEILKIVETEHAEMLALIRQMLDALPSGEKWPIHMSDTVVTARALIVKIEGHESEGHESEGHESEGHESD